MYYALIVTVEHHLSILEPVQPVEAGHYDPKWFQVFYTRILFYYEIVVPLTIASRVLANCPETKRRIFRCIRIHLNLCCMAYFVKIQKGLRESTWFIQKGSPHGEVPFHFCREAYVVMWFKRIIYVCIQTSRESSTR